MNVWLVNQWLAVIKIVVIGQIILMLMLVLVILIRKSFLVFLNRRKAKKSEAMKKALQQSTIEYQVLSVKQIKQYRRSLVLLIPLMRDLDQTTHTDAWKKSREALLKQVLLPQAKQNASSSDWYKRYLATQVYQFSVDDLKTLMRLISDFIPLVALNAAKVAFQNPTQMVMDQLIACFTKNRRLQRWIFTQIMDIPKESLCFIFSHLNETKDPYARALCYQILDKHADAPQNIIGIKEDMNDEHLDLQIAALSYYCDSHPQDTHAILIEKIKSPHWEVRARAATLMGKIKDGFFISPLASSLRDESWWVRTNSAEALMRFGQAGIAVLKKQKPEIDQYAYDAANRALASFNQSDKK